MTDVATDVVIRDGAAGEVAADVADAAQGLFAELVAGGAALGWVDPPSRAEIGALLAKVAAAARAGDGALRLAYSGDRLAGLGYWLRYERPTHRPHADLEKLAVASETQGMGVGRLLASALVDSAREAGIEVLTLDARGDNENALHLYRTLGFREYGRLPDFVAVGDRRYDKVFSMLDLRA
ncbi:GNAT family N-acetyltransferase [Catenulispora sp. NL8]|uniref:GNAT family N-acetyltransferase n=1 Tax=Catenulispora pinistramenti TaxID=2705254 RepID=A0ABS5KLW3_9ACTN|nr:GNAT family N-acetyltransferase [Catenulispora pinistramenti]MBS2547028.1 GNAT family N-acetyltransferase [Catenulispora pinistramenti]